MGFTLVVFSLYQKILHPTCLSAGQNGCANRFCLLYITIDAIKPFKTPIKFNIFFSGITFLSNENTCNILEIRKNNSTVSYVFPLKNTFV